MTQSEVRSINGREISDNYARNQLINKLDKNKINDDGTGKDELWSADKVNAQFNTKANKDEVDIERKRIDSFTSLTQGSTTGDAELIDGRVGADGVVYNNLGSSIRNQIGNLNSIISDNLSVYKVNPELVTGKYINASNDSIAEFSSCSITKPISVKKGQTVKLTATGTTSTFAMICVCNSDNTERKTVVNSIDATERLYQYEVEEDGFVCCGFLNTKPHSIYLGCDYLKNINELNSIDFTREYTKGYYVSNLGSKVVNTDTQISSILKLNAGDIIKIKAKANENISVISECDSKGNITRPLVIGNVNTNKYEYIARYDCNIIVSTFFKSVDTQIKISRKKDIQNNVLDYFYLFENCICIGDSLTRGLDGQKELSTNYPYYFKKITGINTLNHGLPGRTAKGYWDELGSTYENYKSYDIAIIYLGTNGGLTDTIDTDINISDYTQNANTNTGCYGKIIGKIKADNPNCKIFLVAGANEYVNRRSMNIVIRKLATLYDCGLIDLENNSMLNNSSRTLYRPIDDIHYSKLGYLTLCEMIIKELKNNIYLNLEKYIN